MEEFTVKSIVDYPQESLLQEVADHESIIERIKNEVCQEYDNIMNPEPFAGLQVPVMEMVSAD